MVARSGVRIGTGRVPPGRRLRSGTVDGLAHRDGHPCHPCGSALHRGDPGRCRGRGGHRRWLHASEPNATTLSTVNTMISGVLFGVAYVLTGELALPIGLHLAWDFVQGFGLGR